MSNLPADWPDIAWDKLTAPQRQRAVDILRRSPDWEDFAKLASEGYATHGRDFIHEPPLTVSITVPGPDGEPFQMPMPWHMGGGMAVRNHLRAQGFSDAFLPGLPEIYGEDVSTWDDFYVQAIEAAIGVRPVDFHYVGGIRMPLYAAPTYPSPLTRVRRRLKDLGREFGRLVRA